MSRLFAGGSDLMTFSPVDWAFGTMLIVTKIATTNDGSWLSFIEGENSGGTVKYALGRHSAGNLYMADGSSASRGGNNVQDGDGWIIVAVTKATGTVAPTFYKIPIGGSRTSGTGDVTQINASAITGGSTKIGGDDDPANIYVAAVALFNGTVLTGTQLDSINTAKTTASIAALSPTWLIDDSDGLTNDLIGSADRTAISGTTSSGDNPSGWVYGLGGGGPTYEDMAVALSGESTLTSAAIRRRGISVALDAQSSLSATAGPIRSLTTALSGESTLAAAASRRRGIAAALDATGNLTAAASVLRGLALALSGQSTFTAVIEGAGVTYEDLAVALSAESSLAATPSRARLLTTVLSAESTFSASMLRTLGLSATLDGQSALDSELAAIRYLAVSLQAEGVLVVIIGGFDLGGTMRVEPVLRGVGRFSKAVKADLRISQARPSGGSGSSPPPDEPDGFFISVPADLTGLDGGDILIWDGTQFEPGAS